MIQRAIINSIRVYQKYLSLDTGLIGSFIPLKGRICVFTPSCSEYTILAIKKYGILTGTQKGVMRILRCHPWQKEHVDYP